MVGFVEAMESENYIYIVVELCDSDLKKLLSSQKVDEERSIEYLFQISKGFKTLIQ